MNEAQRVEDDKTGETNRQTDKTGTASRTSTSIGFASGGDAGPSADSLTRRN